MSEKNEKIDDGGPAFGSGDATNGGYVGMSLRDWFAGQALVGLLANYAERTSEVDASAAYSVADAMIKRRKP